MSCVGVMIGLPDDGLKILFVAIINRRASICASTDERRMHGHLVAVEIRVVGGAIGLWTPPILFGATLFLALAGLIILPTRQILRWRLPAFKEASLAEVATVIWLMLKNGVPLNDALQFAEELEKGTRAESEIAGWRQRLASGRAKFSEIAVPYAAISRPVFPPLFVWSISQSGEDLAAGFKRTADLYQARAMYRTEMLLYSALPCSILLIAALIISQLQPVFQTLMMFIQTLSGDMG